MHKCEICDEDDFETAQALASHAYNAHERTYPIGDIVHGTTAGYQAHRRRAEQPCSECRTAWRNYFAEKRSRRGK